MQKTLACDNCQQKALLKTLSPIIQLQTTLYEKQQEYTKGLRNKMPFAELKALHEEIRQLYQELIVLRSTH